MDVPTAFTLVLVKFTAPELLVAPPISVDEVFPAGEVLEAAVVVLSNVFKLPIVDLFPTATIVWKSFFAVANALA